MYMEIWWILSPFGGYFSHFDIIYQEKSGNPVTRCGQL
jgi:hypothetical protein